MGNVGVVEAHQAVDGLAQQEVGAAVAAVPPVGISCRLIVAHVGVEEGTVLVWRMVVIADELAWIQHICRHGITEGISGPHSVFRGYTEVEVTCGGNSTVANTSDPLSSLDFAVDEVWHHILQMSVESVPHSFGGIVADTDDVSPSIH